MSALHQMKLNNAPFNKIKSGYKTIELRLNDEKRQKVQVGDFICFSLIDNAENKITVRVIDLHHFDTFSDLYSNLPKEKIGYLPSENPNPDHMDKYYSIEEQKKYGVLGIEFRTVNLQRYVDAQEQGYEFGETYYTAFNEIKAGKKLTHWIWYILPQIKGMSEDRLTEKFALVSLDEAIDYYDHPILGNRLLEIINELLKLDAYDPVSVFGSYIDAYKLRSCMTLFKCANPQEPVFQRVLDKFCLGVECNKTLVMVGNSIKT